MVLTKAMGQTGIFRDYRLSYREKCGNSCSRQALRLAGMLLSHPGLSLRQGILKAMIGLTYDCQCSCSYCCSGLYARESKKELSEEEVRSLIDDIASLPSLCTLVSFFGGEALLKEYIFGLISHACARGLFTETETNGMILSAERVRRLKSSGLHHIFVRIESSDPAEHDRISGVEGCFRSAYEGIRHCSREKLPCSISTIAFKDKIYSGELERIVVLARGLGASAVRILYPTAAGRLAGADTQLLSSGEKERVRSLLDPDFVYLESTHVCTKELERICPSRQKKFFYVSCYGELQPCPFLAKDFGNIRQEKIGGLLKRMQEQMPGEDRFRGACLTEGCFSK